MPTNSCGYRKRKGDFVKWLGRKVGSGILLLETIYSNNLLPTFLILKNT